MATFVAKSNTYGGRYLQLSITQTKNVADNTSTLNWVLTSAGGSSTYYTIYETIVKINGQQVYYKDDTYWNTYVFPAKKGSVSGSITVAHNSDGSLTVPVYFFTSVYDSYYEKDYGGSFVLDKIDRFASLVSVQDFTDEENPVIKYSNPAGDNVTSLQACISLDGATDLIEYRDVPKNGTEYTFNLTDAERLALLTSTKNSNTLKVFFYLRSVIGGNDEHDYRPATMTVVNANPVISASVEDTDQLTVSLTGDPTRLIPGYSVADVTFDVQAQKGAYLDSQTVKNGDTTLTGTIPENAVEVSYSGVLSPVQNDRIKFTVEDSRGNTTEAYADNVIIPYIEPTCYVAHSVPSADGDLSLKVTGKWYNGSFGAVSNSLAVYYRYGTGGAFGDDWLPMAITKSGNDYTATAQITGLDYKTAYSFQARVVDTLKGNVSAVKVFAARPVFDWGNNDFKFNVPVYDEHGTIYRNGIAAYTGSGDAAIDPDTTAEHCLLTNKNTPTSAFYFVLTYFYIGKTDDANKAQVAIPYNSAGGAIYRRYKTGGVWSDWLNDALKAYPVNSIYISWSHTSPAELFGGTWTRVINTETGAGVFLYGCTEAGVIGEFGGEAAVTLATNQLPSHHHGFLDFWATASGNQSRYAVALNGDGEGLGGVANSRSYTADTGGGEAHNNIPPFVKVSVWRRVA